MATEEEFLAIAKQNNYGDGTTAIVAFISENGKKLTVGNIGDSEAVLCRGGKVRISLPHKDSLCKFLFCIGYGIDNSA